MVAVNGVLHLSTSLLLFLLLFIIAARVPCVWFFFFPLPRTRADCVRAFEHINYLLMLTFEGDAVFVLAPTARVSRRVYITEPLPRQQTEPQSQREREWGGRCRNPWKWWETNAKQEGIQCSYRRFYIKNNREGKRQICVESAGPHAVMKEWLNNCTMQNIWELLIPTEFWYLQQQYTAVNGSKQKKRHQKATNNAQNRTKRFSSWYHSIWPFKTSNNASWQLGILLSDTVPPLFNMKGGSHITSDHLDQG